MTHDERNDLALQLSIAKDVATTLRSLPRFSNPAEYDMAGRALIAAIERIANLLGRTHNMKSHKLDWYLDCERGCLEAVGGSTDGDSSDLYYRIQQVIEGAHIKYVESSNPELMTDDNSPQSWDTLNEAMEAMQQWHDEMMESAP